MIVMKFGGTSNEDAKAMSNVIRIVKAHLEHQPIVVISAIAKATNELELAANTAAAGRETDAVSVVTRLFERHTRIIDNLINSRETASHLEQILFDHLNQIKDIIKGISILRELTPRSKDAICSHGERLSSRIVAAALREAGVDAVWTDAREFMVTDAHFGQAEPIMVEVQKHLHDIVVPMVKNGQVPVTQGFIGVTHEGAYTTMGRESSDYSASIIGAAIHAERVQIWTDVDGILTADPRVVGSPRKVNRMSFSEAFELSYFGAKVLHPNTMLPVLEKGIPVQILNSKREGSTGTWVGSQSDSASAVLKSIAYKSKIAVMNIIPRKRLNQYMFWEGIFNVLNRHNIPAGLIVTSEYSISIAFEQNLSGENVLHDLQDLGEVTVFNNKGSLCLVGTGLRNQRGIVDRVFRPLASINITMISFGGSDSNITLVMDDSQIPEALNRLHAEFFESTELQGIFETISHGS